MAEHPRNRSGAAPVRHDDLHISEERFRLLVESVRDYAIFMLDSGGHIVSWNAGAQRIKGYRAAEIIGKHFSTFYTPEDVARGWPQRELEYARRDGRFEDEGWRVRKDGTRFWANVIITAMYDRLGDFYGFAKVTRDLTETRRMEALEQSGRRTNEFLAMLAHELRNPLAPIRNAVSVLQMTQMDDPRLVWTREVLDRQVAHLTRLVDDLLDVSRITSGKIALESEPVDLTKVVGAAIEATRSQIEARGHELVVAMPDRPILVLGDTTRLIQVFVNLLNNAAKYTPEGGTLTVRGIAREGYATITVLDTGIGIRTEMLPRIFELFTQGERGLDRSEGGMGIGLTLVRRLVSLHGGRVIAASPGVGLGSEFAVQIPLLSAGDRVIGPEVRLPPQASSRQRLRVLVVDDNHDSAESMRQLLELWGHVARVASDGTAALAEAPSFEPNLVLLDIGLPGMDGYEVARRLRSIPQLASAAVVAMTGYGQDEDRRRSTEAGFSDHLVKPVDPTQLKGVLVELERRATHGES